MTVRAKFKVQTITKLQGWGENPVIHSVRLAPVTGGSPENAAFYAATPTGSIELSMVKDAVGMGFDVGQEFYVEFSPAGK